MKRESIFWILAFSLAISVTQIGNLERERASGDESTYIVTAAHVLDGYLPYVELFDTKPPMIFILLAGAMAVFGDSQLVVRAVGDGFLLVSCAAPATPWPASCSGSSSATSANRRS